MFLYFARIQLKNAKQMSLLLIKTVTACIFTLQLVETSHLPCKAMQSQLAAGTCQYGSKLAFLQQAASSKGNLSTVGGV